MDYDDIDYDEGYSIRDIDSKWLNSNMDYDDIDSDSNSDMDNYNYNYNSNTNNWSTLTENKINRQTNRHSNSLLNIINKKLESLENIDRSTTYTRVDEKNDSFLDLYDRLKALNSPIKKERGIEPHHRSLLTNTMTDNWHINNSRKDEIEIDLQTLKAADRRVDGKTDPIKERATRIEDKRKNLTKERISQKKEVL